MGRLFNRTASIKVGQPGEPGVRISDLRFEFSIEKTITAEPNALTLAIYNASGATRGKVNTWDKDKGLAVELSVGYAGQEEVLYRGQATKTWSERQGPDWITKIECGDGAKQIAETKVSKSFGAGASVQEVLAEVSDSLGVTLGEIKGAISEQFANGFSIDGLAKSVMDKLSARLGADWSIQDGELQVLSKLESSGASAIILSPSTGLLGSPTKTDEGIDFESLIIPGIRPGRLVELRDVATVATGFYKVGKMNINGDTRGEPWGIAGEAVAASAP